MKKQITAMVLATSMLLIAALTACSNNTGNGGATGGGSTPTGSNSSGDTDSNLTAKEQEALDAGLIQLDGSLPIILDVEAFEAKYGKMSMNFVNDASRLVPPGDLAIVQTWFEDTGVRFDWLSIPGEGATEKIGLMLTSSDDLPNVFWNFGDGKSGNTVVQYADQEVFIPTENLIKDYMPNLSKILDNNEQYRMEITAPDGHSYGFPYIEEMFGLVLTPGPFVINKTWLDAVGQDVPTTVDEWVDCLRAFRDGGDLNGNGIDDEIPMANWFGATDTFGSYNIFYRFTGAFGAADSYSGGNAYADHLRIIDDEVVFTAKDEAFRKTAEFFHMLYEENLIWNGSFEADDSASFKSSLIKEDVARIGSFGVWGDQEITNLDVHDQYVAIPRLQGEAGMTGIAINYSELQDSSNTAITTTCEFPHVVAKFVDYIVGDPALSIVSNWGPYNYEEDENGILRTPLDENGNYIGANPDYSNFGDARSNSTPARGSYVILDEYYEKYAGYAYDAVQLLEMQKTNGKVDILAEYDTVPRVMMDLGEIQKLAQIQPTVSDIVDRYITTWVTSGVTDSNWQDYLSELDAAGVNDIVSIYQTAYDRAKAAINAN